MSKQDSIPSLMSKGELANLFDVTPVTIDGYMARGVVEKPEGKFNTANAIKSALNYFRAVASRRTTDDDDALKSARIEETIAKTRRTELEIAEKERQLVGVDDVQILFSTTLRELAVWIDGIPDSFERQGILDKRGVDKAREQCDHQRKQIYAKLERNLQHEMEAQQLAEVQAVDDPGNRKPETTDTGKRKRGRPRSDNSNA